MICYQSSLSLNSIGVTPTPGESLLGDYKEGRTGGSLAQFTDLKNRGSWDVINSFSWITKIRKLDTVTVFEGSKITNG